MKSTWKLLAPIVIVLVAASACSGGEASDDDSAAPAAEAAEEEVAAPTPTATPDPTPAPTATTEPTPTATAEPEPEPIFTRVVLPGAAVSEDALRMTTAQAPHDDFDWLAIGRKYVPRTGIYVPTTWEFDWEDRLRASDLPLPANATDGWPWYVADIGGRRIVGGQTSEPGLSKATLWRRDSAEADWQVDETIAAELTPEAESSWLSGLAATDDWGLAVVSVESNDKVDDEGEPVVVRHLLHSVDGLTWEPLEVAGLADFLGDEGFMFPYVNGDQGLVVARIPGDEPASTFFRTSDAGKSWTTEPVTTPDGVEAAVRDALWNGESWVAVGWVGEDDAHQPAVFVEAGDGWQTEFASIVSSDEVLARDHLELQDVAQRSDGTLIAIVDTEPGAATLTSTDGLEWTHQPSLSPNQLEEDESANMTNLTADVDGERFMAVRAFKPPVWISSSAVDDIWSTGTDSTRRNIEELMSVGDNFMFASTNDEGLPNTQIWKSEDGTDWSRETADPDHRPVVTTRTGDQIVSYGSNSDNEGQLRLYADGKSNGDLEYWNLFDLSDVDSLRAARTAPAIGRNLLAMSFPAGDSLQVQVTFVATVPGGSFTTFAAPSLTDSEPRVICPELDWGAIAIITNGDEDRLDSSIEVWSDRAAPRLGSGTVDGADLSRAVLTDCASFGEGLIATGTLCPPEVAATGDYSRTECEALVLTSASGLTWVKHPQIAALIDAEVSWATAPTAVPGGALIATNPQEGDDNSLWLVTADAIVQVPTDDTVTWNDFDITDVAVIGNRVVLASNNEIFSGDLNHVIERAGMTVPLPALPTLDEEVGIIELRETRESADPADAAILLATGIRGTPAIPAQESTTPPSSSSSSAPPPAPAPTGAPAAPVATATPVPSTSSTPPQCNPGDLTTTGACRCSGGRLYDDGGQCKLRCRGSEQPDGFGGCTRSDGTSVESGTGGSSGSGSTGSGSDGSVVISSGTLVCTTTTDSSTGQTTETCEIANE